MIVAKVKINGVRAAVTQKAVITAGMVGAQVQLEYTDSVWEGLRRTVVFYGTQVKSLITDDTLVTIPAEVIAKANRTLVLGVYGVDETGTVVIPTLLADLGTVRHGASLDKDVTADPALPVWAQLLTMIGDLSALDTGARSNLVAAINEVLGTESTVDAPTVSAMVQDALAQAKASGAFDGTSPRITVETIAGGHRLTLTDAAGTQTVDVLDGLDGAGDTVPDYVQQEADRVIETVLSHRSGSCLTFLAMADSHQLTGSANITAGNRHAGQAAAYIADRLNLDFACFLGDATYGSSATTLAEGKAEILQTNAFLADAFRGLPRFRTPGNHDPLTYSYESNGTFLREGVLEGLLGGWGYRDFPEQKVRVICLNTADVSGLAVTENTGVERVSTAQLEWFCDSLDLSGKDDARAWSILILSHHPADWGSVYPLANILAAYEAGSSIPLYSGCTVDFAGKNSARVLAQFHGHTHCYKTDSIHQISGGAGTPTGIQRIAIPNMCFNRNNEYGANDGAEYYGLEFGEDTTYNKTANTAQDTAFCVVTVDLENRKIYADHYGAGYDRVVDVGVTYSVTANLTNVTLRSSYGTRLRENEPYTADLVAQGGNVLQSVTITMGGVDITDSVLTDDFIAIPSVTGDIVITAAATAAQTYTNLVPTAQAMDSTDPYNGVGYKNGYYISSESPFESADATTVLTGYIPYAVPAEGVPETIYIRGAAWNESNSHCRINLFRASKTEIVGPYIVGGNTAETKALANFFTLETLDTDTIKLTPVISSSGYTSMLVEKVANSTGTAFIRFSLEGTGENLIITAGEPIGS